MRWRGANTYKYLFFLWPDGDTMEENWETNETTWLFGMGLKTNHLMPNTVGNCGGDFHCCDFGRFWKHLGPGVFTSSRRDPEPGQRESLCGGIGSAIHAALAGAPVHMTGD